MRKLVAILAVVLNVCGLAQATHIVGGEFEIKEKRGGLYDVYLNLYFDAVNGNPQAIDNPVQAVIFDKATNSIQEILNLSKIYDDFVPYENPDCAIDPLKTKLLRYRSPVGFQFDPAKYSDPEGYYIVYDRCCRNNIIDNIVGPEDTGMLFYLWFPAIYKQDGSLTGYSSPVFNIISTRYACLNEYFYMDYGATDADGDSLVYSMIHPLGGYSNSNNPIVPPTDYQPEPYPEVIWVFGYSEFNAIHGTPALNINSTTGLLEIVASEAGLYVFSVVCEEFRNGVKIGEVRRDYQILVAPCDPNDPPTVYMKDNDTSAFYKEGDTVTIKTGGDRCFNFLVTDDKDPRVNEKITFSVDPVNFESNDDFGLENQYGFVGGVGDTLDGFQLCWPDCEFLLTEPYILDVIVADDGCILPKKDTIRLLVVVEPNENETPDLEWTYSRYNDSTGTIVQVTDTVDFAIDIFVDSLTEIVFSGYDVDTQDVLTLYDIPIGFTLAETGMTFNDATSTGGSVTSTFSWRPDCELFESLGTNYSMYFYVKDNSCYPELHKDSVLVEFNLKQEEREVEAFIPANIFTPNGDGKNDVFTMPTLPNGVCGDKFVQFEVFNRWGRKVYGQEDRDFIWDGSKVPDGMYYYVASFEQTSYKGYVLISR